ncbi:MAG: D-amino acid dehydrogenase 1 [Alphaproteobacteria bacterium MarineAlpha4_Bin2]|nr:MAG: D-amino acid dehydrogenase 1 [Alphaproteobacteria bacterium MarineAlpha4_Bin2]
MSKNNADITVLGAGIVGICTALSLSERGFNVMLLDRSPPAEGASYGNAGSLSPWSCVPQSMPGLWKSVPKWLTDPEGPIALRAGYAATFLPWALKFLRSSKLEGLDVIADAMMELTRPTVDLYRHHLSGTGQENLVRDSVYVHVYRKAEDADLSQLAWRLRRDRQVPVEMVKGEALREVEPALSESYEAAVLIKEQGRAMDPGAIGKTLAEKAQSMGVEFRQSRIDRLRALPGGAWEIETEFGMIPAKKIVVAIGAWSGKLLSDLGVKVALEAERGYHLVFKNPGVKLNNAIMNVESKFVVSSMNAGVRCAGTAEFAGVDAEPDYRRAKIFGKLAKEMFPDLNTNDTEEWMGPRPSSPDSVPFLGEIPGFENIYAAFGHGHTGMTMGPKTGEVIASLIAGENPGVDMHPYRINRF